MTEEKRKEVERLATDYIAARQRVEALMCQAMPDKQEEARAARVEYEIAVAVAIEAEALLREAQKFAPMCDEKKERCFTSDSGARIDNWDEKKNPLL